MACHLQTGAVEVGTERGRQPSRQSGVWRYEKPPREMHELWEIGSNKESFTFLNHFPHEIIH